MQANQLDAAAGALRGNDRVGAVAHLERVDAVGPREPVEAGPPLPGLPRILHGAVPVHADQLDGALVRGHCGVRAAVHGNVVDVQGVA